MKMKDLTFSVAMCVYEKDNPDWFKEAINSVLNQTITPNEIVLVVDGPIPPELSIVVNDCEKKEIFKIVRFETNQGHGKARDRGLRECKNDLVALMDSDDISLPYRFEKQLELFANDNSLSIVGGQVSEFFDSPTNPVAFRLVPETDKEIKEYLKKRCPLNQPTVMFKKKDVDIAGGYLDWYCNEDYYLWIRMALKGFKMANTSDILVNMRLTHDSYRRRGGLRYFKSEKELQKYMLNNKIIRFNTYFLNVIKRFIVQVIMPNRIRGWAFRKFARSWNEKI